MPPRRYTPRRIVRTNNALLRRALAPPRASPKRQTATKSYVRRLTALDRKRYRDTGIVDTGNSAAYDDDTIISVLANAIPTGTSNQRFEFHKITGRLRYSNLADAGAVWVRTVIFQWHETSDDAPTVADVMANSASQWSFLAPINFAASSHNRFTILKDFHIRLGEAAATDGSDEVYRKIVIPGKRLRKLQYEEAGASANGKNTVYVYFVCPVATASNPPLVDMQYSVEGVLETYSNG